MLHEKCRKFMIISISLFFDFFVFFDQKQTIKPLYEDGCLFSLIWKWFEKSDRLYRTSSVIYLYDFLLDFQHFGFRASNGHF